MLIHPLAERMRDLGLTVMADALLETQTSAGSDDLSREDWLGLLLDREATHRDNHVSAAGCSRPDCARMP
jgi:hypothetical protein